MKSPKMPAPPDPNAVAKAQTTSNVQTAVANTVMGNANEVGPLGNVTYRQTGTQRVGDQDVPMYERTTTLSPDQQKLYDQSNSLEAQQNDIAGRQLTQLDSSLSKPFSLDGLPEMPTYDRQHFEDALYGRLQPQMDRDRSALETKLANQGVNPESEAYREAIALNDRSNNDARYGAVLQGGEYANQEMSQAATARERALQERLVERQTPLNEISALMSGGQATLPQFTPYRSGTVAGTDTAGITMQGYKQQLAAAQAKAAQKNAMMGGLFSLGGSLLAAPFTGGTSLAGGIMGGLGGG